MFPVSQFTSATAVGKEIRKLGVEWKVWVGYLEIPRILPIQPDLAGGEKSTPEVWVRFRGMGLGRGRGEAWHSCSLPRYPNLFDF